MGQLHEIEPQLIELGYRIIAVSPDRPEKIRETLEKKPLNYLLVSDRRMLGAKAFGIAFRLDDGMLEKYKGFGIGLEDASGETHRLLPVPSVFVTGTDGEIRFSYVNPDYKVRIDAGTLLAAARASAKR